MKWHLLLAVSALFCVSAFPTEAQGASLTPSETTEKASLVDTSPTDNRLKDEWDDWDESIDDDWIRERDRDRDDDRDRDHDRDYRDRDDFDGIDDRRGRDRRDSWDDWDDDDWDDYRDDRDRRHHRRHRDRDDYYYRDDRYYYYRDGRHDGWEYYEGWSDDDGWGDRRIYRRHESNDGFNFILRILDNLD
ncbi:hypothetical protein [Vacuolonema iberomarrocanum]|uniref:hypothetical protein n=1 Tax=Vacuolonema iberomarrocanum TaxID=3454632 RepID=UPI0019FCCF17|nr:hypothetical protein [filamentous cyanobacterium LEGE 07170]